MKVGFVGMTHLGLVSATASAEKGASTICFDPDESLISNLIQGEYSISEPLLPELLLKNRDRIQFSFQYPDLNQCDIVYVSTDVPTNEKGESDLTIIHLLIKNVVPHLSEQAILVILCQVPPGFTRSLSKLLPLDRVYYQVETLIFGCAIERALCPERIIVGCKDPDTAFDGAYHNYLKSFDAPICPMRYESAELSKISINCCLVASVTTANMLSELSEHVGADWSEIASVLKLDRRIGSHAYLMPGLGIAGGNLERDLATILKLSEFYGTETSIVSAWLKDSPYRRDWVLRTLHREVFTKYESEKPRIAMLGVAYKENTNSTKNSPALSLLSHLKGFPIAVYDPAVSVDPFPGIKEMDSILSAVKDAACLVIMTPWPEFREIDVADIFSVMAGKVIVDPYQVLQAETCRKVGFDYFTLGARAAC